MPTWLVCLFLWYLCGRFADASGGVTVLSGASVEDADFVEPFPLDEEIVVSSVPHEYIVIISLDGTITAVAAADGSVQWQVNLGGPLYSMPTTSSSVAGSLVPALDGSLFLFAGDPAHDPPRELPYTLQGLCNAAERVDFRRSDRPIVYRCEQQATEWRLGLRRGTAALTDEASEASFDDDTTEPRLWLRRTDSIYSAASGYAAMDTEWKARLGSITHSGVILEGSETDEAARFEVPDAALPLLVANVTADGAAHSVQALDPATGEARWDLTLQAPPMSAIFASDRHHATEVLPVERVWRGAAGVAGDALGLFGQLQHTLAAAGEDEAGRDAGVPGAGTSAALPDAADGGAGEDAGIEVNDDGDDDADVGDSCAGDSLQSLLRSLKRYPADAADAAGAADRSDTAAPGAEAGPLTAYVPPLTAAAAPDGAEAAGVAGRQWFPERRVQVGRLPGGQAYVLAEPLSTAQREARAVLNQVWTALSARELLPAGGGGARAQAALPAPEPAAAEDEGAFPGGAWNPTDHASEDPPGEGTCESSGECQVAARRSGSVVELLATSLVPQALLWAHPMPPFLVGESLGVNAEALWALHLLRDAADQSPFAGASLALLPAVDGLAAFRAVAALNGSGGVGGRSNNTAELLRAVAHQLLLDAGVPASHLEQWARAVAALAAVLVLVVATLGVGLALRLRSAAARASEELEEARARAAAAEDALTTQESAAAAAAAAAAANPLEQPGARPPFEKDGQVYRWVSDQIAICEEEVLGEGSHGTVVFGGLAQGGRPCAVKRLVGHYNSAAREADLLMRSDKHPLMVRLFAKATQGELTYLALERCHGTLAGQVANLAKRRRRAKLRHIPQPSPQTRVFLHELVQVVAHLHDLGVVHRDIKPHNILVSHRHLADQRAAVAAAGSSADGEAAPSAAAPVGGAAAQGVSTQGRPAPLHLAAPTSLPPPYDREERFSLGLHWQPRMSDMGLGKQLDLRTGSSFGRVSSKLRPRRRKRAPGDSGEESEDEEAAGAGATPPEEGGSSRSTGGAPGSMGWQAPELLALRVSFHRNTYGLADCEEEQEEAEAEPHPPPATPELRGWNTVRGGEGGEARAAAGSGGRGGLSAAGLAQVQKLRRSRAVDVWSLGCVLHFILDGGRHPFGDPIERELHILRGKPDLRRLQHLAEAHDLLAGMLAREPARRPTARESCEHPLFWDDRRRLAFMQTLSNRLETEPPDSPLVRELESHAGAVIGAAGWDTRLPKTFLTDGARFRDYNYKSLQTCLRFLRNKHNHFSSLPADVLRLLAGDQHATDPTVLAPYFARRSKFPQLLMATHRAACATLAHEPVFAELLGPLTAQRHAAAAAARVAPPPRRLTPSSGRSTHARPEPAAAPAAAPSAGDERQAAAAAASAGAGQSADRQPPADSAGRHEAKAHQCAPASGADGRDWFVTEGQWLTDKRRGAAAASREALAGAYKVEAGRLVVANKTRAHTNFGGGAHVDSFKYKTNPCADWANEQRCGRGWRCDFAHGPLELRGAGAFDERLCLEVDDAPVVDLTDTAVLARVMQRRQRLHGGGAGRRGRRGHRPAARS